MNSHRDPPKSSAIPRFTVCRLPLVLAGGALLLACCQGAAAAPPPATGITEPFLDVMLSAPVPGIVTARKVQEGDFVNEGTLLLELDKRIEELEVERRRLVRDQRRNDFEATQKLLLTTKGTSKEEAEKKEAEYKVAAVEQDMAVEQLRRRHVTSPLSGAITQILLEVGEACQPYQPLVRVVDARRCYFITNLEARLAAGLTPGQTVKLEFDTAGGTVGIPGTIVFLSPVVDPASGLQKIKVLFENSEGKVRPGVSGRMLWE